MILKIPFVTFKMKKEKSFNLRIKPVIYKIFSTILFLLSGLIVFSEVFLFFEFNFSIIGFLINSSKDNFVMLNIYCQIPITYLLVACLYGLFNFKFSGYYGIYKNRKTDSISLYSFQSN